MRLNRGTIGLFVALVAVLVTALFIGNQQATAPTEPTSTPDPSSGALFPDLAVDTVARVELREPSGGSFVELARLDATNWSIEGTGATMGRVPDNIVIESNVGQLTGLEYTARFESDQLADFGLTTPAYVLFVETGTGEAYTLYIGNRTPTNPRYYAVVEPGIAAPTVVTEATADTTGIAADVTPEATSEPTLPDPFFAMPNTRTGTFTLSGTKTIAVIPQTVITALSGWLFTPPYAAPTPTPLPSPTPEVTPELTPELTPEVTIEATVESTADAGS